MMYKVIKDFRDLKDRGWIYRAGDDYPRPGIQPDEERARELAGSENRMGFPLIKAVEEKKRRRKEQ